MCLLIETDSRVSDKAHGPLLEEGSQNLYILRTSASHKGDHLIHKAKYSS